MPELVRDVENLDALLEKVAREEVSEPMGGEVRRLGAFQRRSPVALVEVPVIERPVPLRREDLEC